MVFITGDALEVAHPPTTVHLMIIFLNVKILSPGCAFFRVIRCLNEIDHNAVLLVQGAPAAVVRCDW